MKKLWITLCLGGLLVLPLAGCGSNSAAMRPATLSPLPTTTPAPRTDTWDDMVDHARNDLAGANGIVGDEDDTANGLDRGTARQFPGQSGTSGMERMENGIGQIMDDMGQAVRDAADDAGIAARRMGENVQRTLN